MPAPKLYWCTTPDQSDDWFVVARSAREARRFFREEEGYGAGDVQAKLVAGFPERLAELPSGWPTDEALVDAGGRFLRFDTPRCVAFGEETFTEGTFDFQRATVMDDIFEADGEGRPNGTRRTELA
jgi:hypothetical protein